jgi:hypothetical protein
MTAEQLRRAIEEPARKADLVIDAALTHALIDDCARASNALPLLQFVLLELWKQSGSSGKLTLSDYQQIGTLSGALNRHAEQVYQEHLTSSQRPLAESIFIRLVQPFQTTRYARQTRTFDDLYAAGAASEQKKQVQEVIGTLAGHDARLLAIGRETGEDQKSRPVVELAHEILISCWDRYQQWLNESCGRNGCASA